MFCPCCGLIIISIYVSSSLSDFITGFVSFTATTAVASAIGQKRLILYCKWTSIMYNYLPSGTGAPLLTHTHVPGWSETGGNWNSFFHNCSLCVFIIYNIYLYIIYSKYLYIIYSKISQTHIYTYMCDICVWFYLLYFLRQALFSIRFHQLPTLHNHVYWKL